MAINFVPSFWDSLGAGVDKGLGFYERERQRQLAEQQAEFQRNSALFNLMQGQAEAGAPVNDQLTAMAEKLGLPGFTPMETGGQLRERMAVTPDLNIEAPMPTVRGINGKTYTAEKPKDSDIKIKSADRFTDIQHRKAGTPTAFQRRQEAVEGQALGIKEDTLAGREVDPFRQQIVFGSNAADFELDRTDKRYASLMKRGEGYVDMIATPLPGGISRENADMVAEAAYQQWLKTEGARVEPEIQTNAKSYFARIVRDRFFQDEKMKLDEAEMSVRRQLANRQAAGSSPWDNMQTLINLSNSRKDWMKGKYGNDYDKFIHQMAGFEALNPEAKNQFITQSPRFKEFLDDQRVVDATQNYLSQYGEQVLGLAPQVPTYGSGQGGPTPAPTTYETDNAGKTLSPAFTQGRSRDRQNRWILTPEEAVRFQELHGALDTRSYVVKAPERE